MLIGGDRFETLAAHEQIPDSAGSDQRINLHCRYFHPSLCRSAEYQFELRSEVPNGYVLSYIPEILTAVPFLQAEWLFLISLVVHRATLHDNFSTLDFEHVIITMMM